MSISFVVTPTNASGETFDLVDPIFMYTQILKEILLSINFEEKHIKEFTNYCRDVFVDKEKELTAVKELEEKYHNKKSIWWYTCENFLYPTLNRALRSMNGDIIVRIGFFIGDLHRHIEQLHLEQNAGHSSANFYTVYRGQGLSEEDFKQMTNTKGGLMSFNNFLSTSKNREVSLQFAQRAAINPDLVGILFTMSVDSSQSTTPFASIANISAIHGEDEVLFSMHSIFRIRDIKPIAGNNRLYEVKLMLIGDNDEDLRTLTEHIREGTFSDLAGWYRLGLALRKMGQFAKAQELYEVLLGQATNESEKGIIYHNLGIVKDKQGEYQNSITFYEKAVEIRQQSLPPSHPDLAMSYNNMGVVYGEMHINAKALAYLEKATQIRQQALPSNHLDLAMSYNNIGLVYCNMGNYSKALSSHEKALEIKQRSLPSNHMDLADSYNSIGTVYGRMNENAKALIYFEKAIEIRQQSLPSNHLDLADFYTNIGLVYYNMGNYSKALSSHEKALEIRQQSLLPNRPGLASSYNSMGVVYVKMSENAKAIPYFEKAIEIKEQALPSNHPDLVMFYNNIGSVHNNMGDYSKAFSFYRRAVEVGENSLPSNHPNLQTCKKNLEIVKKKL